MAIGKPFNLQKWIQENKDLLKPPVGNKNLYVESEDYIVMIVGGPNARKDYHYNETEELFYQLEGEITVYIQENGKKKAMKLSAGDMYLHPAKVPHSPARTEGSVGLVIERKRAGKGFNDGLLWLIRQVQYHHHFVSTIASFICHDLPWKIHFQSFKIGIVRKCAI